MAPGECSANLINHTTSPIVTGATVIGIKYAGGVLVAADTLASYGTQKRYKEVCRMKKLGQYTLLGSSGEHSDFQYLGGLLDELADEDWLHEDNCSMGPKEYSSYIGNVMYNRRSKFNPLYNQFVVVGKKKNEESYLTYVDHQGTKFEENFVATGFGAFLAIPLLRNGWTKDITKEAAIELAKKCLELCFYRDRSAFNKIQIGICESDKVQIMDPITIEHFWGHGHWLKETLTQGEASASW